MEKSLPKGWVETKLGDVTTKPQYGWTTKSTNTGEYKYLRTTDIGKGDIDWNRVPFCQYVPDDVEKYLLKENDILISRAGSIGLSYLVGSTVENSLFASYLIRFKPYIVPKFISYYLNSMDYWKAISDNAVGIAVQNINAPKLQAIPFPLPPLPEQERIVAKLDKLFAQHEKIKRALDRIPQLLKAFRQQVLTQAVTGKLTEQWREGRSLDVKYELKNTGFRPWKFSKPSRWKVVAFGDVADVKSNLVDPNNFSDYFLIAPDNIEANTGKLINTPLVSEVNPKSGKHLFNKGVIIYSKIRPYLNKLIIADFYGLCSADMYPIDKTVQTEIKYIYYYMLSNEFLSYSTTAGERSVLPKINQKGLNEIPFPLPAIEEQKEIVRRVESLFAKADTIEERYQALKAKIARLPQAILHKAFKGELVPQLPTDGDAKDLLAEIMALKKEVKGKR